MEYFNFKGNTYAKCGGLTYKISNNDKKIKDHHNNDKKIKDHHKEYELNTDENITIKCTVCGNEYPATEEYFYKDKYKKYGIRKRCKKCTNKEIAEYRKTPNGRAYTFNKKTERRAKEKELGDGITGDQWLEMMKFFNWKCAYTGESVSSSEVRTIDHIIPIKQKGPNEPWNVVPMTRSANSRKSNKNMEWWYRKQDFFSEERLAKIREWQEYAYKKYSKK